MSDQISLRLLLNGGVLVECDSIAALRLGGRSYPKIALAGMGFISGLHVVRTWLWSVRIAAVYLNSAEGSILAFLPFIQTNNLRFLRHGA